VSDLDVNGPQQTPKGTGREITPLVIKDLEIRSAMGKQKYGEALRAFNGRNALVDAYQEAIDLVQYLRQRLEEESQPEQEKLDAVDLEITPIYFPVSKAEGLNVENLRPGRFIPVEGDPCKSDLVPRYTARAFIAEQAKKREKLISAQMKDVADMVFGGPVVIYLSGPMTGLPNFNIAEFERFAKQYRDEGFEVISPPELDAAEGTERNLTYEYYLRRDVQVLLDRKVTRMYMIPGWQKSKGARLEHHVAETLGIAIYDATTGKPYSETVLQEAQRLVHGDRGDSYGHPIFDLTRTADILTAVLREKLRVGVRLEAEDIAKGMVGVKLSRETFSPKRDNRVDACGYTEVLDMIVQWRIDHPGADPRDHYGDM